MLPETSLGPTNSYLAFMSAPKHTGGTARRGPEGSFGHVPRHPQPDCLPCSYADQARTNDASQTIQHPGLAGEHLGFMPFPLDRM
jgi:hypothetical protein